MVAHGAGTHLPLDLCLDNNQTLGRCLHVYYREHAVAWHARELRRYSQTLRDTMVAVQQQCSALQPLQQPTARLSAGLEQAHANAQQLQGNLSWLAAAGAWLQGEGAAMAMEAVGRHGRASSSSKARGGIAAIGGDEEQDLDEAQAVPELADEVVSEAESIQAAVQESLVGVQRQGDGLALIAPSSGLLLLCSLTGDMPRMGTACLASCHLACTFPCLSPFPFFLVTSMRLPPPPAQYNPRCNCGSGGRRLACHPSRRTLGLSWHGPSWAWRSRSSCG